MWEISGRYFLIPFPLSISPPPLLDFYARPHSYKSTVLAAHTRRYIVNQNSAQVDLVQSSTTIHTARAPKLTANNLLRVITHFGTPHAPTGRKRQSDRILSPAVYTLWCHKRLLTTTDCVWETDSTRTHNNVYKVGLQNCQSGSTPTETQYTLLK
jgi:hypothetical protein